MSKHKHSKKIRVGTITIILLLIIILALILFLLPQLLYVLDGGEVGIETEVLPTVQEQNKEIAEATEATESTASVVPDSIIEFPYVLENGSLEIESALTFDGVNPDCNNQTASDIASIVVKNTSGVHLAAANFALTASNGEVFRFSVTDLPAGASAVLFSLDNASIEEHIPYTQVSHDVQFDVDASMCEDQVSVSVEGTLITLQNNTDAELNNIVVYCRSTLGDQYFGGVTYNYTVNNLAANGTAEVDAVDCILGLAEVVRIAIDHT